MTDDEPILLEEGEEFGLEEATYRGRCPDCYDPDEGEWEATGGITFQLDPDPDSPSYSGKCSDCGDYFVVRPKTYTVDRYDAEE